MLEKKQTIFALSTAEVEYVALSVTTQLLSDLGEDLSRPTIIHKDNQSTIAASPVHNNHTN